MKLNHGRYQRLLAEDTSLDEITMHSIETGITHCKVTSSCVCKSGLFSTFLFEFYFS